MKLILLMLLFASSSAYAAAPSLPAAASIPSITSGVAPLCVFFDATATTSDETDSFRSLLHQVSFGDASAGNWSYGSNTSASKNFHIGGPMAAHCYYTAGTYTWSWMVTDSAGLTARTTGTITVTSAATVFATNTMCVANGSTPAAGADSCPAEAVAFRNSSDLDATLAAAFGANGCGTGVVCKRVLFKAGHTFTSSTTATISVDGPGIIGSYGSGRAVFKGASDSSGYSVIGAQSASVAITKWRIMDVEIDGESNPNHDGICVGCELAVSIAPTDIAILNVYVHHVGNGVNVYPLNRATYPSSNIFVHDSTISNIDCRSGLGGCKAIGLFADKVSVMGNLIEDTAYGEHLIRAYNFNKLIIARNHVRDQANGTGPNGSKEAISLRARDIGNLGSVWTTIMPGGYLSRYAQVDGNWCKNRGLSCIAMTSDAGNSYDFDTSDIIIERNYFYSPVSYDATTNTGAYRVTARNNIYDMTNAPEGMAATTQKLTTARVVDDYLIANNTIFSTTIVAQINGFFAFNFGGAVTNSKVINNLGYLPNRTTAATKWGYDDDQARYNLTTNSPYSLTTAPTFVNNTSPTTPAEFRPTASSGYPVTGTATATFTGSKPIMGADFYGCSQTTGARLGAMVPRTLARCAGVAGP